MWLKTADGSQTAFSNAYQECYSSISDGAKTEKLNKHILPAFVHYENLSHENLSEVKILDICFGLGYTAFLSAAHYSKACIKTHIISLEQDKSTLDLARKIHNLNPKIIKHLQDSREIEIYRDVSLRVIWGDAKANMQNLVSDSFDIIYQDPFSFDKNPELWDEDHFKQLFRLLKGSGIITTYTTKARVREIARDCEFLVYKFIPKNTRQSSLFSKMPLSLQNAHLWNP